MTPPNCRALSLHAPTSGRQLQDGECAAVYVGRAYETDNLADQESVRGASRRGRWCRDPPRRRPGLHRQCLPSGGGGRPVGCSPPAPPARAFSFPSLPGHPRRLTCLTSWRTPSPRPAGRSTAGRTWCWTRGAATGTRPPWPTACLAPPGSAACAPRWALAVPPGCPAQRAVLQAPALAGSARCSALRQRAQSAAQRPTTAARRPGPRAVAPRRWCGTRRSAGPTWRWCTRGRAAASRARSCCWTTRCARTGPCRWGSCGGSSGHLGWWVLCTSVLLWKARPLRACD